MENQLVKVINESGLDKSKAQILLENFSNYFEIAADWESKAKVLIVTSEDQKAEMKMAREGRLFLKEKRIAVDKTRKALKESALREGQTIDAIAKVLTNLIIPIENDLEQKEKFVEIQEAKRKAELKSKREIEIQPYIEFIPFGIDLGSMDEESFQKLFNGAKLQLQQKLDAERKAEEERIAKEKAEAEERERIRKENERLKAEAEAKEKQLIAEREKAEAERKAIEEAAKKEREENERKLKAEQEASRIAAEKAAAEKAKLEAEIKAKAEAEEKERKETEAKVIAEQKAKEVAEKKAKNATDKTKLIELKKRIDEFVLPEMNSDDGRHIVENVHGTLSTISYFLQTKISKL